MSATEMLAVLIGLVGGYFGVSKLFFPASSANKANTPSAAGERPWYEVLGVAEDCPKDAIQAAYERLMEPFRPEKMAALQGDLQTQAAKAVQQITRAFETGMRLRGALR